MQAIDGADRLAAYDRMRERARHSFARFAETLPKASDDIRLLGTSGTVTTLASVHLALAVLRPPRGRRPARADRSDAEDQQR